MEWSKCDDNIIFADTYAMNRASPLYVLPVAGAGDFLIDVFYRTKLGNSFIDQYPIYQKINYLF